MVYFRNRVKRIYLDELGEAAESSLGVGVVKLVIESEENLGQKARALVQQAKQQLTEEAVKRNFIDLVETILVYKLPGKTWEEVKAMFGLEELKQTRVYQDGYQEGQQAAKLELIGGLVKEGLSIEQIARVLQLPVEVVQQEAQKAASTSDNS
ncbi:DUF2887 domain-containing protein [Gloeothece verrucosa]|uniref:DUF2887 domain-containing protein n=1 Tax=Gloeothece verrucosa TaxID=2546359 RepID=UPI00247A76FB|nr:DUF2887 domain-containing protein [Gloeothece verrucosa]